MNRDEDADILVWPAEIRASCDPQSSLLEELGSKALGLAILPSPWTPKYSVLRSSVYSKWLGQKKPGAGSPDTALLSHSEIEELVIGLSRISANGKWKVILRSSANRESICSRGQFESHVMLPNAPDVMWGSNASTDTQRTKKRHESLW